jgi:hypothetical protein
MSSSSSSNTNTTIYLCIATRMHTSNNTAKPSSVDKVLTYCQNIDLLLNGVSEILAPRTGGVDLIFQSVIACDVYSNDNVVEGQRQFLEERRTTNNNTNNGDDNNDCFHPPLLVQPWGNFVPALNALLSKAGMESSNLNTTPSGTTSTDEISATIRSKIRSNNGTRRSLILYLSQEMTVNPQTIVTMIDAFIEDSDTLVIGIRCSGHDVIDQQEQQLQQPTNANNITLRPLNGTTTPWNTLAMWDIPKLGLTGFPLVAEGIHPETIVKGGGVEEVSAITLLQKILALGKAKAKLLCFPDDTSEWKTGEFEGDPVRKEWHDRKMKSKVERPAKQIAVLFPEEGGDVVVEHIHFL